MLELFRLIGRKKRKKANIFAREIENRTNSEQQASELREHYDDARLPHLCVHKCCCRNDIEKDANCLSINEMALKLTSCSKQIQENQQAKISNIQKGYSIYTVYSVV